MKHVRYIGKLPDLVGRSALLRTDDVPPGVVLAQFDFPPGTGREHDEEHPECFGWHTFAADEFVETDNEHEVRRLAAVPL